MGSGRRRVTDSRPGGRRGEGALDSGADIKPPDVKGNDQPPPPSSTVLAMNPGVFPAGGEWRARRRETERQRAARGCTDSPRGGRRSAELRADPAGGAAMSLPVTACAWLSDGGGEGRRPGAAWRRERDSVQSGDVDRGRSKARWGRTGYAGRKGLCGRSRTGFGSPARFRVDARTCGWSARRPDAQVCPGRVSSGGGPGRPSAASGQRGVSTSLPAPCPRDGREGCRPRHKAPRCTLTDVMS